MEEDFFLGSIFFATALSSSGIAKIAACSFVIPISIPSNRALSFNANTRTCGGLPSSTVTACSRSNGSARAMAAMGKSGM